MSSFQKVVVAVDGSEPSARAARVAARLADGLEVPLALLHVFPMVSDGHGAALGISAEDLDRARKQAARQAFDHVLAGLSERPEPPEEIALMGDVAEQIIDHVDAHADWLLIMGRRGHSRIADLLMGSVSDKVVRHLRGPVTVVG